MTDQAAATDTAAVEADMRDHALTQETMPFLESFDEPFDKKTEEQGQKATERWAGSQEILRAQSAAFRVASQVDSWYAELNAIGKNRNLSAEGRASESQKAQAEFVNRVDKMVTDVQAEAATIRATATPPRMQVEKPARTHEAEALFWAKYPHVPRATVVREATDLMRVANDPKASSEAKIHANYLLESAHLPALQRTYEAPERYARGLQPLAGQFVSRIQRHLDIVTNRAGYEATVALADDLASQAKNIKRHVLDGKADRFILGIAAPKLLKQA
jgi:hypothetical protein